MKKRSPLLVGQGTIDELKRLAESHSGVLLPQDVVKAARPESSPLHNRFEWDDNEAAEKYRLWQARYLISISVEIVGETKRGLTSKVFVSLSSDRYHGGGYRSSVSVMSDERMRGQMLEDALENMEHFRQKYRRLQELASVISAMGRTANRLRHKKQPIAA